MSPGPNLQEYKVSFGSTSSSILQNNMIQKIEDSLANIERDQLATVTRKVPLVYFASTIVDPAAARLPDAAAAAVNNYLIVPDDYVSGDLTVKLLLRGTVTHASQVAVLRRAVYRMREGAVFATLDTDVNMNQTGFTANQSLLKSFAIAAANFQANDLLRVDLARVGADGGDTYTGGMDLDGGWFEYLGRS